MSYADGYTAGRKLADEALVAAVKRLEAEVHYQKHLQDIGNYNLDYERKEVTQLKSQLTKADKVIEAGRTVADQIIGESVYKPSTSTDNAGKFFELLADYKRSAAQNDQNIR